MATVQSPPILIYTPGGGVPVGPVSNPPVYSQAGTTQLVEGQAYIDVVFGSIQTDDEWVLVECIVVNEIDVDPLNIWPGIITDKTQAGFRLQLNGMPDSSNYYLHWAVSGVNITPSPASTYYLSGPATGGIHVDSTAFTVSLPPSTTVPGTVTVTPDDGGLGGTFTPASVTLTSSSRSATFTYTPTVYGAATIGVTNSGGLIDPASIAFTCVATGYGFTGPVSGNTGVASTDFTVELPSGSVVIGTVTVTPSDAGDGGTFTPTTTSLTTASPSATFTYTPSSGGAKTISVTNNGGLTNPGTITYTATVPFDPSVIAGLKLWLKADALALSDGATVSNWPDSSGTGNDFGTVLDTAPIFKTGIVNSKPVVRFGGAGALSNNTASIIAGQYTVFVVARAASLPSQGALYASGSVGSVAVEIGSYGGDLSHYHFGSGLVGAIDGGGTVAGVWNVVTCDWDGANIHLWRNGTLKGTTATAVIAHTGTVDSVGYDLALTAGLYPGDITDVLVYDSALSTTDRQAVELYLKTKYAIP